jgi:hypothetical protein
MPLHLTRVAYGAQSLDDLIGWFRDRPPISRHTTRYLPKRHAEILPDGSLYWILKHQLVARCPIAGFEDAEGGRTNILLHNQLILTRPVPRRAHQGWRYLEGSDAPVDLGDAAAGGDLPPELVRDLAAIGLI